MELLVTFLSHVDYISFCKKNFPQNIKKNLNYKNAKCYCIIKLEQYKTQKGKILKIYENITWEMYLLDCLYNDAKDH